MIVKRVGLIGKGGRGAGGWGGGGHAPRNEESAKCLWRSFLIFKISAIYVQVLKLLRRMSLFGPFGMAPNSVRIQFRENLASKAAKAKAAILHNAYVHKPQLLSQHHQSLYKIKSKHGYRISIFLISGDAHSRPRDFSCHIAECP